MGQTAIFELLVMNDAVAQSARQRARPALRLATQHSGMRSLLEEGVLLVAQGVTSVQELMRVMKP